MTKNKPGSLGMAVNIGEPVTVTARDPATGATATVSMTIDTISVPDAPPEPEPPQPVDGSARWLSPLEATATSKETGPIVVLTAWGGQGWGYSYRYALNGAPQGVSIDADTGVLSIATALQVRDWTFGVVVTDRTDATLLAMFDFTLHVVAGNHKTYKPEDFGGNLINMHSRIISDQAADEELRVTIQFAKGKTYKYDNNHWLSGIRYYRCEAVGNTGAAPILQCTLTGPSIYDNGPLNVGGSTCFTQAGGYGMRKDRMALVASADVGDDVVTLLNAGDGGRLKPGLWHAVFSYSQQLGGYPPNVRNIDFAKVVSVDGTQVTLDRPLNHAHMADYWEDPNDEQSIGKARIGTWDMGDGETRCAERGIISGFNLAGTGITYMESHIFLRFENCSMPDTQLSMCKYIELKGCTIRKGATAMAGEPDKLSDTLVMTGCTMEGYIGGATGFTYMLTRDSKFYPVQISPRQFRDIGSTFDSHGDTYFYVPWGGAYNGPCLEYEFDGTHFVASTPQQPTWCYGSQPRSMPLSASSWQGNKLVIPRSYGGFQDWLVYLFEGIMVFTGPNVGDPQNYGRVDKVYAPADGSALWADVTWIKGTKPTSGNLNLPSGGSRKMTWLPGTAITEGRWQDPSYVCLVGTPEAARAFPDGIS